MRSSGYGSEISARITDGAASFFIEPNKYYRIRSTGTTSAITYTKLVFEEIAQQYAVNINDEIINGTVTTDKDQAISGETVTITAKPLNEYFAVDPISVTAAQPEYRLILTITKTIHIHLQCLNRR